MSIFYCPTNVRFPTQLDNARAAYLTDRIDVEEFERIVGALLAEGIADKPEPMRMGGLPPVKTT